MKLDVNILYRLKGNVRISCGFYNGTVIPAKTLVKVIYWDNAVANCESIEGPCDGLTFVTSPAALKELT